MRLDLRRTATVAGLLLALLTAGCGGVKRSPAVPPQPSATEAPAAPPAAVSAPEAQPAAPPVARAEPAPSAPERVAQPASANEAANAKAPPAAKAPAKSVAPAGQQPAKTETAQAPAKKQTAQEAPKQKAEAPLDLASLETRLKETKAIGVLTKIALKNQVDDLLNQFRAFYAGKLKTTLAELRRPYDLLVLKVLSLLQDSDPSLAAAIVASREAIWGILSDRVKFAEFASN